MRRLVEDSTVNRSNRGAGNICDKQLERAPEEGCTVLISVGRASAEGRTIIAKNRDVASVGPAEIMVLQIPHEGNRYLGMSTVEDPSSVTLGINEKGVICNTAGRYCREANNPGTNAGVIISRGLQSAQTAKEMVARVEEIVRTEGKSRNGSAFASGDQTESYVVETYQRVSEVYGPLRDTVLAYGNYALIDKMKEHERKSRGHRRGRRAQRLMEKHKGKITVPLMIRFCRDHERTPERAYIWDDDNICTHGFSIDTRGSGLCVTNKEYPELLNVIWGSLNRPCHTPYIPFFMGMNQIPDEFATSKAYEAFEALGTRLEEIPKFKGQVQEYWEALEYQTLRETIFLEKKVLELADKGEEDLGREMLTRFVTARGQQAVANARKITERIQQQGLLS